MYHHMYIGNDNPWVAAVLAFFIGQVVKPKCLGYLHHVICTRTRTIKGKTCLDRSLRTSPWSPLTTRLPTATINERALFLIFSRATFAFKTFNLSLHISRVFLLLFEDTPLVSRLVGQLSTAVCKQSQKKLAERKKNNSLNLQNIFKMVWQSFSDKSHKPVYIPPFSRSVTLIKSKCKKEWSNDWNSFIVTNS